MTTTTTFMGVTTTSNNIADRNELQRKAELGLITPKGYLANMRASFSNMSDAEKTEEASLLKLR
jgi:hypothetical protein